MLADRLEAPDMILEGNGLEFVEHALNVHEVMFGFHFADTHPLGLPCLAEGLAGLGEAETLPLAFYQRPEQDRRLVPPGGEEDRAHVLPGSDIHVRLARETVPVLAVEFEEARLVIAILVEAVVGDHDAVLRREAALEMRPGGQLHLL